MDFIAMDTNELSCTICLELFIDAVTLNCAHSFCDYCILQWQDSKSECPICRKPITSANPSLVLNNCIDSLVANLGQDEQIKRRSVVEERQNDGFYINLKTQAHSYTGNDSQFGYFRRDNVILNSNNFDDDTSEGYNETDVSIPTIFNHSYDTDSYSDEGNEEEFDDYFGEDVAVSDNSNDLESVHNDDYVHDTTEEFYESGSNHEGSLDEFGTEDEGSFELEHAEDTDNSDVYYEVQHEDDHGDMDLPDLISNVLNDSESFNDGYINEEYSDENGEDFFVENHGEYVTDESFDYDF